METISQDYQKFAVFNIINLLTYHLDTEIKNLPFNIFNTKEILNNAESCREFLEMYGDFSDAVRTVERYLNTTGIEVDDNFDFDNENDVAIMLLHIIGERILNGCQSVSQNKLAFLDYEIAQSIKQELENSF